MQIRLRRCRIAVYWDGKGGIIMKIAIIYYSQTGHTREMGSVIAEGIERAGGEARLFSIEEPIDQEYVDACDGVIIGTPTWVANTCWQIKNGLTWTAAPSIWPESWEAFTLPPTMPREAQMWRSLP